MAADEPLYISFAHWYQLAETGERGQQWRVSTTGYLYTLEARTAVGEFREILAFHWDQRGGQMVIHPHLHIRSFAGQLRFGLNKAHIPTGQITLASVVRFLIEDMGAVPRRSDWEPVLDRVES